MIPLVIGVVLAYIPLLIWVFWDSWPKKKVKPQYREYPWEDNGE